MDKFTSWIKSHKDNPYIKKYNLKSEKDLISLAKEYKSLTYGSFEAVYELAQLDGTDTDYVLDIINYLN